MKKVLTSRKSNSGKTKIMSTKIIAPNGMVFVLDEKLERCERIKGSIKAEIEKELEITDAEKIEYKKKVIIAEDNDKYETLRCKYDAVRKEMLVAIDIEELEDLCDMSLCHKKICYNTGNSSHYDTYTEFVIKTPCTTEDFEEDIDVVSYYYTDGAYQGNSAECENIFGNHYRKLFFDNIYVLEGDKVVKEIDINYRRCERIKEILEGYSI